MLGTLSNEMREIAWLASVAGTLTIAGVSLATAAAVVLERLA
jgi:hypothetical protein